MDNFEDIQQVWLSAKVDALPKAAEVLGTIKRYRMLQQFKISAIIAVASLLLGTMIWVVFVYHSQLLSTRIGEGGILSAICILLSVHLRTFRKLSASKALSNKDFLMFLKEEQKRFAAYQKKTQVIGFILASTGLLLYVFEQVRSQLSYMIIAYTCILGWCGLSWYVIRPVAIKRKEQKMQATISRLEEFSSQLNDESN